MPALFHRRQIYDRVLKPQGRHEDRPTQGTAPAVNTAGRPLRPPPSRAVVLPSERPLFPPPGSAGLTGCLAVRPRTVHRSGRARPPRQTGPRAPPPWAAGRADGKNHTGVYGLPIHSSIHHPPDHVRSLASFLAHPTSPSQTHSHTHPSLRYELGTLLSGLAARLCFLASSCGWK